MRALHDINPKPLQICVTQKRSHIVWRIGKRKGKEPLLSRKPAAIASQIESLVTRFNTPEVTA